MSKNNKRNKKIKDINKNNAPINSVDEDLKQINKMLNLHNYAMLQNVHKTTSQLYNPRQLNKDNIRRAVLNPYNNVKTLQEASVLLKSTNGIYARIINYLANMLTYDYTIFATQVDKIKTREKMQKSYLDTAIFLESLNIKRNAHWITRRVIEQGELYLYKLQDNNGVIYQEIPASLCMVTGMENNILKYAINLQSINKDTIESLPVELQKLKEKFDAGKINKKLLINNSYYELPKNAVAFNLDRFASKCFPMFSYMFEDLMELENAKDLVQKNNFLDSVRMVHQQLPINAETGRVLMDYKVANAYHQSLKSNLPNGTFANTSPLKLTALSLASNNNRVKNEIETAKNAVYDSAGVNSEIFNAERSSNESVIKGVITDSLVVWEIQEMIQDYINYELSQNKKGGTSWQIQFLGTTIFNKDEAIKRSRDNIAFGGSRSEFMASNGYSPLASYSILKTEQLLGLDELLIPQQSAHTLSSSSVGRPSETESESTREGE